MSATRPRFPSSASRCILPAIHSPAQTQPPLPLRRAGLSLLCALSLLLPLGRGRAQAQAAPVAVIVYLKEQPFLQAAEARQAEHQAQAAALLARVAAASAPAITAGEQPLTYAQEIAEAETAPALDTHAAATRALAELDALRMAQRRALYQAAAPDVAALQAPVADFIRALGGEVTARIALLNALGARVPPEALAALAQHPAVAMVEPDTLAQAALDSSPGAIRAEAFWNGGYTGGVLDVGIIDTGIDHLHPALLDHGYLEGVFLAAAGGAITDTTTDDLNGHGTHIAGIVGSRDLALRGVAHGFDTLLNAKAGFDMDGTPGGGSAMFSSDSMDAAEWALFGAAESADVLNLSFGACPSTDDSNWARFFDALVGASGVPVAIAAGNNDPANPLDCDEVFSPSLAYNVISVANVDDTNDTNRANDTLYPGSNLGPTLGGRLKPDLAAPGAFITSTNAAWETQAHFKYLTGTSMAAPHVAGAAVLLLQAGVTDPRAIKALLINTAEDKGPAGWDSGYGWGYLDLAHTYIHRGDSIVGSLAAAGAYQLYQGPALPGDRATLVWNRHVTYPCDDGTHACFAIQPMPPSNLNLAVYSATTNSLLDSSVSVSDTVEQVQMPGGSARNVIRVSLLSLNPALSQEDYALATEEGFTPASGPLLTKSAMNHVVAVGVTRTVDIRLVNTGDLPAHGVQMTVTVPAGLGLVPITDTFTVGFLDAGATYTATFSVALEQDEARQFTLTTTGAGYGAALALNDTVSVVPLHHQVWLPLAGRFP